MKIRKVMPSKKIYNYCLLCGRKLVNPLYRVVGYGPICLQKMKSDQQKKLF